jgi:integrase
MGRKATGSVIVPDGRQRSYAIRFTAYGKRRQVSLGRPEEGWTQAKAETELRHVLADVERGIWRPTALPRGPVVREVPGFHGFASQWLAAREPELAPRTVEDYRWSLSYHLLPFFADHLLTDITIEEVDRYKTMKAREGRLSPSSINKTLTRLSQVLETAVEYGHLPSNPAVGRRRRVRAAKPSRPHVEPEQLMALLNAAEGLTSGEGKPSQYRRIARPLLATLAGSGLRIGEALALQWRDVSLGGQTIVVRQSKTDAGVREVDLTPALGEELAGLKASLDRTAPHDPVFASDHLTPGRPVAIDRHRARERILKPVVWEANPALQEKGIDPIGSVTLHGLRRTFASLRIAAGDDPVYVSQQLGHTSPTFTMTVYAKAAKRRSRLTGEVRAAFDEALEWAEVSAEIGRIGVTPRPNTSDLRSEIDGRAA